MNKLWHETSEQPEYPKRVVIEFATWDGYHGLYDTSFPKDYPVPWEDIVARDRIVHWCYFDDLHKAVLEDKPEKGGNVYEALQEAIFEINRLTEAWESGIEFSDYCDSCLAENRKLPHENTMEWAVLLGKVKDGER